MMYARIIDDPLGRPISDADLERFDWYIVLEVVGGIKKRIITAERPA